VTGSAGTGAAGAGIRSQLCLTGMRGTSGVAYYAGEWESSYYPKWIAHGVAALRLDRASLCGTMVLQYNGQFKSGQTRDMELEPQTLVGHPTVAQTPSAGATLSATVSATSSSGAAAAEQQVAKNGVAPTPSAVATVGATSPAAPGAAAQQGAKGGNESQVVWVARKGPTGVPTSTMKFSPRIITDALISGTYQYSRMSDAGTFTLRPDSRRGFEELLNAKPGQSCAIA
jgi:hypothetical protein